MRNIRIVLKFIFICYFIVFPAALFSLTFFHFREEKTPHALFTRHRTHYLIFNIKLFALLRFHKNGVSSGKTVFSLPREKKHTRRGTISYVWIHIQVCRGVCGILIRHHHRSIASCDSNPWIGFYSLIYTSSTTYLSQHNRNFMGCTTL